MSDDSGQAGATEAAVNREVVARIGQAKIVAAVEEVIAWEDTTATASQLVVKLHAIFERGGMDAGCPIGKQT